MANGLGSFGFALALCGVVWVPMAGHAQTRDQALAAAYNDNPELKSARAAVRVADEGVAQAMSGWRPNFSGSLSYGFEKNKRSTGTGQHLRPFSRSLELRQSIYAGGRTEAAVKQAEAFIQVRLSELRAVEQRILLQGITAYMDVLQDTARADLTKSNEIVLRRQLQASKDRFEVGEITRTDVSQSEARLSRAIAERVSAVGAVAQDIAAYKRVMGQAPGTLEKPPQLPSFPSTVDEAIAIALKHNPTLQAARGGAITARHNIKSVQGRLLPTIDLVGRIQHSKDITFEGLDSSSRSISAVITIPFYQSGQVFSQIREAKEIRSLRIIEAETTRRAVIEEVSSAFEALVSRRSEIVSRLDQVRANRIALEGVRQEAAVGSRTTLDVLDAEQELLDARVSLVITERNEYVAGFRLLSALGQLSAKYLNLPVELYDPKPHADYVRYKWLGEERDKEQNVEKK